MVVCKKKRELYQMIVLHFSKLNLAKDSKSCEILGNPLRNGLIKIVILIGESEVGKGD